jgi:hypothetical protein
MIEGLNGPSFFLYICYMISVIEIFNVVRDIANKEQRGFVTPEVFNTFADVAQKNIFNEMFQELLIAQQVRSKVIDPGRYKSIKKNVIEDLSRYIQEDNLGIGAALAKPQFLARVISATTQSGIPVEVMYDTEKVSRMLNSRLSSPTADFPVCAIQDDINVYPVLAEGLVLKYYRQPTSMNNGVVDNTSLPTYSVTVSNANPGTYIVNPLDIRDFDLPNHYKNEITTEILKLMGVRLRDADLFSYAKAEDAEE